MKSKCHCCHDRNSGSNFFAYYWPTLITLTAYAQLYVNEFKPLSLTNVNDVAQQSVDKPWDEQNMFPKGFTGTSK